MKKPKILVFAGSTRTDSYNKKLAQAAAKIAGEAGAAATYVDLRDLAIPLYDGDLEDQSGLPEGAKKLKGLLRESDGFIIASPEYNSSVTGVLKNAIDWASRSETDDEPSLVAYRGKAAVLLSASPGALGGLRGLVHLRAILGNIGVIVLPEQVAVSKAYELFDDSGMKDDPRTAPVAGAVKALVAFLNKHVA